MYVKSPRHEKSLATRTALVAAARDQFGSRGFSGTSLDDVCQAAGLTKGALYHHFSDKEELFRAVAVEVIGDVNRRLSDHFLGLNAFEALEAGCRTILDAYLDPPTRQIVWVDARAVLSSSAYGELRHRSEQVFIRATLRRAIREGFIDPTPLGAMTAVITGAIAEGCAFAAASAHHEEARREIMDAVMQLLQGLRRTKD